MLSFGSRDSRVVVVDVPDKRVSGTIFVKDGP
jgi:hypothetical protein